MAKKMFDYEVTVEKTFKVKLSDSIPFEEVDAYLEENYEELGTVVKEEVTSIECVDQYYE